MALVSEGTVARRRRAEGLAQLPADAPTLETHLERHLQREFGLSESDFEILVNLSESETGRMRAFELAEATQWEKSRMSHHLTRMEKRGLIRKEACDARYPEIVDRPRKA